ncbi:MAG: hypothetical protein WA639_05590 [Candidatus Acidiferrum sp.]
MRRKAINHSASSPVCALLIFSALLTAALVVCASTLCAQSAQSSASDNSQPAAAAKTASSPSATKPAKPAESGAGMVWVNTATGVYHKKGSRWYGKTKKGKYMLEEDAIKAGYKPAK